MKHFVVLIFLAHAHAQLISPCPRLFQYDPPGPENDRWYANVTLLSESELPGIWLRLIFDRPSIQLGNWFGEVFPSNDNKEYLVKNRNHKLAANVPYNLRFYIKYNPAEPPPQLVMFRLNAKIACPENPKAPITTRQTIIDSIKPTLPVVGTTFGEADDDFFHGDFSNSTKPRPDEACGTVDVQMRLGETEFPWHAGIYHAKGVDLTYVCGASLITPYHLITVAHCVTKRKSQETLDPDNLVVFLGKFYLKRWSNPGIQDKRVEKITVHPKYNSQSFVNDIGIIKVASPMEVTNYVRPVCLWEEDLQLEAVINKPGTVVGWGVDENDRVNEQLTKVKMPVVSQETCIYSDPDFYSRFTSSKTYCAGFRNGTSVCHGNPGGGMVFPKSASPSGSPVWQLRGLVSIRRALQNQDKCDSSQYVVFTDVAKYLDWIKPLLN